MKAPLELREQLVNDYMAVCRANSEAGNGLTPAETAERAPMWQVFYMINAHRSYGDDHPQFQQVPRLLPHSHKQHSFINVLYDREGYDLNDETLGTALRWAKQQAIARLTKENQ